MPNASFRRLPTARPDLVAIEITGRITKADVEQMAETVRPAFDAGRTIDILLILRAYDGLQPGAVFDLAAAREQARSPAHVRRYAVVGAPDWIAAMIRFFDPLSPIEAKPFAPQDEAAAWAWVDGT